MHVSYQVMVKLDAYEKQQAPAHSAFTASTLLGASQKHLISINSVIWRENLWLTLWLDSNNVQTYFYELLKLIIRMLNHYLFNVYLTKFLKLKTTHITSQKCIKANK